MLSAAFCPRYNGEPRMQLFCVRCLVSICVALWLTESASSQAPVKADRYGDPLPAGALARLGSNRFWHGPGPRALAFTDKGKSIISGGQGGKFIIWDRQTGLELRRFHKPGSEGWFIV